MVEICSLKIKPILLILDNPEEIHSLKQIFAQINPSIPLIYLPKIKEGVDYFQGEGIYKNRSLYPIPQLVLLDLNLPDGSSFQFLEWLKLQRRFKKIPLVVLSEPCLQEYKQLVVDYGAEFFLNKPLPFPCLISIFNSICTHLIQDEHSQLVHSNMH
ncbi:MAG: hypothetical protein QNJ54_07390 [Prochloraceae cyanobacterium]|nr:hypothetical protein [Prochloraceae cyanobacterium]